MSNGKIALVTGASSGIGKEFAKLCAKDGFGLTIAADEPAIETVGVQLRSFGVVVKAVETDLSTVEGVDRLLSEFDGRSFDLLIANAGRGLGKGFIDQDWADIRRVIDTNVTGTTYLVQRVARKMVERGVGRILLTGSIAGLLPGTFQAVYNATKAYVDSFGIALRHELDGTGVSVTVLMPGATDTRFFERADMLDTKIGQEEKDDPADVARAGYQAMMSGEEQLVTGWKNKLQVAAAHVTPAGRLAEQHRKMAEPGTGDEA